MPSSKITCTNTDCAAKLIPANAATNFSNPCKSVTCAIDRGYIRAGQRILDIGAGNLRNSLHIYKEVKDVEIYAYEIDHAINRFPKKYDQFKKLGGRVVEKKLETDKYDTAICTFVLETICPKAERVRILQSIRRSLKKNGKLIASFRGYKGVRGTKYTKCPLGEGLITPLKTFVKPYSIPEVNDLLSTNGFTEIQLLVKYRVPKPENIHLIAQ